MDVLWDLWCARFEMTAVLIIATVVLVATLTLRKTRPYMIPPGPRLLPVIGNLHLLLKNTPIALASKLQAQYGDIYSVYFGPRLVVVLCGLRLLKEAFVKDASIFSDRPQGLGYDAFTQGRGIVMSNGEPWKVQRRFMIVSMRDLGMGKNIMQSRVIPEMIQLKDTLTALNGRPFCPHDLILPTTTNVMLSVLVGKRFERDDPNLVEFSKCLATAFKSFAPTSLLRLLPFVKYLPGNLFQLNAYDKTNEFLKAQIKERRDNLCPNNVTSFTEAYLLRIQQDTESKTHSPFDDENLLEVLGELMVAGSETTMVTSEWLLLFLTLNQDVQSRVHQEIDTNLGETVPTYNDRLKLPYLEAAIMETQRCADVLPFSVMHSPSEDAFLDGYRIPKGTIVVPFFTSVMHNPKLFPEPDKFRPERFVKMDKTNQKEMGFIPFSLGKRSCPGESLARMEMFLLIATIMQHFRLVLPDGYELPSLEGNLGQTKWPPHVNIRAIPRSCNLA